jgi:KDO2-lipid IV(A) lauroyltransferase
MIKKIRRQFYYYGALLFSKLLLLLPYHFCIKQLARFFGNIAYYVTRDSSDIAKSNLRLCFPEKSEKDIEIIVRKVFVNETKNFLELVNFPKMSATFFDSITEIENKHLIEESMKKGKGVLLASAHIGNWEMTAASIANMGIPISGIAKKIYIDGLNDMLVKYRMSKNVKVILKDEPDTARKLLKCFKNGEMLVMLIDQDTNVPGVFVDFFGMPAWTPSGVAVLALKRGMDVLVGVDQRIGEFNHKIVIKGPVKIEPSGNLDNDIVNLTQKISLLLEEQIRAYPEQWVWFHKRWETKNKK